MPGKPFYSMEEVCAKLGRSADQIKGLVRDGTLREFRDAGKVFFKAEDIDKLAGRGAEPASADSGEILLEAGDSGSAGAPPDDDLAKLADSAAGGTSIIGLEPLPDEEGEKKEDTVITKSGIGVFDDDELEIDADPMAKTQITTGATDDQVSLEGAGSGSGLLDLAREADDTALGADLLDEIYPGEEEATATAEETPSQPAVVEKVPEEEPAAATFEEVPAETVLVAAPAGDTAEGLFSGLLVGALALMALAAAVIAGAVQGFVPDYGKFLGDGSMFYFFLGGAVLLCVIALLVGWLIGRAFYAPRRR